MIDGIDVPAAPVRHRRNFVRALTIAGVSAGAWFAISLASTANAQSPVDEISSALQKDSTPITLVSTATDVVQPVVDTVVRVSDPVVQNAIPVVEGAADIAAPVAPQAVDVAKPFLDEAFFDEAFLDEAADVAAPIADQVAEVAAPVVDQLVAPVLAAATPIVDEVATVTTPVVPITGPHATPLPIPAGNDAQAGLSVAAVSSAPLLDAESTIVGSATFGDRPGGGMPATGAEFVAKPLVPNAFAAAATGYPAAITDDAPVAAAMPESSTAPAGRAAPAGPVAPRVPGPAGVPGCPGLAGIGSVGAASPQLAAIVPAGQHIVLTTGPETDGDHAAALLSRCDEPGTSPG